MPPTYIWYELLLEPCQINCLAIFTVRLYAGVGGVHHPVGKVRRINRSVIWSQDLCRNSVPLCLPSLQGPFKYSFPNLTPAVHHFLLFCLISYFIFFLPTILPFFHQFPQSGCTCFPEILIILIICPDTD